MNDVEANRIYEDITAKWERAGIITKEIVNGEEVVTLTEKGFQYAKEQGFTTLNDEAKHLKRLNT